MVCEPMARALVLKLAEPFERVPVPSVVVPSLKVIVPVADAGVMLAVRVTLWPDCAELELAANVSVDVACVMVTLTEPLVELALLLSPA